MSPRVEWTYAEKKYNPIRSDDQRGGEHSREIDMYPSQEKGMKQEMGKDTTKEMKKNRGLGYTKKGQRSKGTQSR